MFCRRYVTPIQLQNDRFTRQMPTCLGSPVVLRSDRWRGVPFGKIELHDFERNQNEFESAAGELVRRRISMAESKTCNLSECLSPHEYNDASLSIWVNFGFCIDPSAKLSEAARMLSTSKSNALTEITEAAGSAHVSRCTEATLNPCCISIAVSQDPSEDTFDRPDVAAVGWGKWGSITGYDKPLHPVLLAYIAHSQRSLLWYFPDIARLARRIQVTHRSQIRSTSTAETSSVERGGEGEEGEDNSAFTTTVKQPDIVESASPL